MSARLFALPEVQVTSVVDPNTLNLDPDPGFWPNLDPDPEPDPGQELYKNSNISAKSKPNSKII